MTKQEILQGIKSAIDLHEKLYLEGVIAVSGYAHVRPSLFKVLSEGHEVSKRPCNEYIEFSTVIEGVQIMTLANYPSKSFDAVKLEDI